MNERQQTPSAANERWKLGLIPVLVGVLVWVIWPAGDDSPRVATAAKKPKPAANPQAEKPRKMSQLPWEKDWPEYELAEILETNPFALPRELHKLTYRPPVVADTVVQVQPVEADSEEERREAAAEQLEARMAVIRKKQVSALFINSAGRSALVGSKVLHEGDLLEEGVRIVKISHDGITVQFED